MQILVNGILTQYQTKGEGKVVLILHGWGDTSNNWRQLQMKLSKNFEVITIDLPGHGASAKPLDSWDLSDYAHFVRDFLKKRNIKTIHAIIGHSNGGAIAMRGLGEDLFDTEKLVLLGAAGVRGENKNSHKLLTYATKIAKILTAPLPSSIKNQLRAKLYGSVGSDLLVVDGMEETFKKIVNDDVRESAAKIRTPTLLLYGQNDNATPTTHGRILRSIIHGADLQVIPNAGHFVYQDQPQIVGKYIEEFII